MTVQGLMGSLGGKQFYFRIVALTAELRYVAKLMIFTIA